MQVSKNKKSKTSSPDLASHLARFFIYNVGFTLLPLIFTVLARIVGGIQAAAGVYAPELLIFGVVVSATALGDLTDESKSASFTTRVQLIKGLLMLGGFLAAGFFGFIQYNVIFGPANPTFQNNITAIALIFGLTQLTTSIAAEIVVGTSRRR